MAEPPVWTRRLQAAVAADLAPMFGATPYEVLCYQDFDGEWILWVRWRRPGAPYGCWFPIQRWRAHRRARALPLDYISVYCWQHWCAELHRVRHVQA